MFRIIYRSCVPLTRSASLLRFPRLLLKRPDYVKTIQVGPSIQFIYRMNVCANTLTTCQQEAAPATEVRALDPPPRACVCPMPPSTHLKTG
jgi:hypothetical protein